MKQIHNKILLPALLTLFIPSLILGNLLTGGSMDDEKDLN